MLLTQRVIRIFFNVRLFRTQGALFCFVLNVLRLQFHRYLQYTLDPTKIKKMDVVSTVNYIAENVAGQPLAWDFVRGQWSYLTQELVSALMIILSNSFSSCLCKYPKIFCGLTLFHVLHQSSIKDH